MPPPSKRQKLDVWTSEKDISKEEVDPFSPPTSKHRELKYRSSVEEPSKLITTRSNYTQIRAKYTSPCRSLPTHISTQTLSSQNIENTTCNPEKPKCKSKAEKARNKNILTSSSHSVNGLKSITLNTQFVRSESSSQKLAIKSSGDDDIISDWDENDLESSQQSSSLTQVAVKKRAGHKYLNTSQDEVEAVPLRERNKKYIPQTLAKNEAFSDSRTWAERFAPVSIKELAVHKRKVGDVKMWLEDVLDGRTRQRVLLLKGPSGSGKTTTLKLLTKSLECRILEWSNPVAPLASTNCYLSISDQFQEFLQRGGKFRQLDLFSTQESVSLRKDENISKSWRSIILIEEFPNTLASSSTLLESFRSSILHYLTINSLNDNFLSCKDSLIHLMTPLVIIISESYLSNSNASADSITAHRLLGSTILNHPGIKTIEFNPIAPTIISKALQLILRKESQKSGRKKIPGPMVLKKIGEIGDIRNAIGSLEFLCLRGDNGDWSAKISQDIMSKSRAKEAALTRMETESLELITQRESSLGIFHAVGKVVHNRRQDSSHNISTEQNPEKLPAHLHINSRPKKSLVLVNELIDEIGTDIQTFIAALHENYVPSCDAAPSCFEFSSIDHLNGCIDALSDSDMLCPLWYSSTDSSFSTDLLYLNEISFQVAVRGLLFSLPTPVVRKTYPSLAKSRDEKSRAANSMFYPASSRLWKEKKEFESMVDIWLKKLHKDKLYSVSKTALRGNNLINLEFVKEETFKSTTEYSGHITANNIALRLAGISQQEMILERLPYMIKILKNESRNSFTTIKELEKIMSFTDTDLSQSILGKCYYSGTKDGKFAANRLDDSKNCKNRTKFEQKSGNNTGLLVQQLEPKLYLSDDDIEDA